MGTVSVTVNVIIEEVGQPALATLVVVKILFTMRGLPTVAG